MIDLHGPANVVIGSAIDAHRLSAAAGRKDGGLHPCGACASGSALPLAGRENLPLTGRIDLPFELTGSAEHGGERQLETGGVHDVVVVG